MAKALFVRTVTGLVPEDDTGKEALRGIRVGQSVAVEVSRPRNIQHHRLYWKLCQTIADNVPGLDNAEEVSGVLKIATGHCTIVQGKKDTYRIPKSISFAAMDQAAFNTFFDKCCAVICTHWLPHMKAADLRKEIEDMVTGRQAA